MGGLISRFPADLVLIVRFPMLGPSLKFMGGGESSGEDATIGAAKARGEDMDDGVDDVGICSNVFESVRMGAWVSSRGGG